MFGAKFTQYLNKSKNILEDFSRNDIHCIQIITMWPSLIRIVGATFTPNLKRKKTCWCPSAKITAAAPKQLDGLVYQSVCACLSSTHSCSKALSLKVCACLSNTHSCSKAPVPSAVPRPCLIVCACLSSTLSCSKALSHSVCVSVQYPQLFQGLVSHSVYVCPVPSALPKPCLS